MSILNLDLLKILIVIFCNVILLIALFYLTKKKKILYYKKGGMLFLGFMGVAVITMMDELTSIFYAPGEAFHFIGEHAVFYLVFTFAMVTLYSFSLTEVAEILEKNNLKGGGVYNFSYLVLGQTFSFIAVASIIVDYITTAAMSSVSAIDNVHSLLAFPHELKIIFEIFIILFIAILNLIGIKENVKVTYSIFVAAAVILVNVAILGIFNFNVGLPFLVNAYQYSLKGIFNSNPISSYTSMTFNMSATILAFSGIESVLQTHSLVENWKTIKKAYITLALTVGIIIPLIGTLALSQVPNPLDHSEDLITFFSRMLGGLPLAIVVVILAAVTLIFAVNTAMVASVELLDRVAEKYKFSPLTATNRFGSAYRIIIIMSIAFISIILITSGNQHTVAQMYAIGLVATFVINLFNLIVYRAYRGREDVKEYSTSIIINSILFILFLGSFIFLLKDKPDGALLWLSSLVVFLIFGTIIIKHKNIDRAMKVSTEKPGDVINYVKENDMANIHIYFRRPMEHNLERSDDSSKIFITFFMSRQSIPKRVSNNHFIIPVNHFWGVDGGINGLLGLLQESFPDKRIVVHLGWPTSSWLERVAMGLRTYHILRLPTNYPRFEFKMEFFPQKKSIKK
ncbi:amino acid permease [Thermodesulfobium sp. 4217-1]|uniref:APC family permease n=1 Tax=Thermodesulfobium sp. 4217-1 TaxID=3120013 RepID=UPI003221AC36